MDMGGRIIALMGHTMLCKQCTAKCIQTDLCRVCRQTSVDCRDVSKLQALQVSLGKNRNV